MLKGMGSDDWTMVAAALFYIAYLACQLGGIQHGTGPPTAELIIHDIQSALKVRPSTLGRFR